LLLWGNNLCSCIKSKIKLTERVMDGTEMDPTVIGGGASAKSMWASCRIEEEGHKTGCPNVTKTHTSVQTVEATVCLMALLVIHVERISVLFVLVGGMTDTNIATHGLPSPGS